MEPEQIKQQVAVNNAKALINHGISLTSHKTSQKHQFLLNYLTENGDYDKWKEEKDVVVNSSTRVLE